MDPRARFGSAPRAATGFTKADYEWIEPEFRLDPGIAGVRRQLNDLRSKMEAILL